MGRNQQSRSGAELEAPEESPPGSETVLGPSQAVAQPIGRDERELVGAQKLSTFPYRAICALKITPFPGAPPIAGTGFFIHPRVVITAGHCIYSSKYLIANPDNKGWPVSVEVIPAMNGAAANPCPHGSTTVTYSTNPGSFRVHSGLLGNFDATPCDYGALLLRSDLGANLGAFPYEEAATLPLAGVQATLAGYPERIRNPVERELSGEQMCEHTLAGVTLSLSPVVSYDLDASPGQSGSPVWTNVANSQHVVVAVHCKFERGRDNCGRRITSEVVDDFRSWIAEAR
ncbi:trypsin-like serine peptidase [Sorangium sp. So ce388]|uniref:trypsin-like serine peptidase n=1 Tax=Sorangium sp. So ce388 TaxID=3133309 RepID=UPI003F5B2F15